jgi:hypothetical protein
MTPTATQAPPTIDIIVVYDGLDRTVRAEPHETIQALLERAMNAFAIHQNRHTLALFTESGTELTNLQQQVSDAGIKEGTRLLLRPSLVRGGAD